MIGPKYQVRVDDLRSWHVVQVTCWACGHMGMVYPDHLKKQWNGYERLIDLERRFRCGECGNRKDNGWQIYRLPRD